MSRRTLIGRLPATMRGMLPRQHLSLVLRFLTEPARDGRLVGNVEVVATGERVLIQSPDDLVQLVNRLAATDDPA
jgi:hypothetical protein